jgi:DNA-binding beta-propeller fold protein YncE
MDIRGPADLGKPNFFDQLGRLVTGGRRQTLFRPSGIAVDKRGGLYITDQELQGIHVLHFGSGKSEFLGRAGKENFVSPVGVTLVNDDVAVSDGVLNHVYVLTPAGKLLRQFDKPGGFARPTGMAFDEARQELYVVDTLAHEVCVFNAEGLFLRKIGEPGTFRGQFNFPTHVFVDGQSRVYVTDSLNFRVQVFDQKGEYLFHLGQVGDASGHVAVPKGVGVDQFGHIYIVDSYFSNVQVFDEAGQFLLSFGRPGEQMGEFQVPTGLAVDDEDRIFVCDSYNNRVQVFQYVGGADDEQAHAAAR